MRATLPAPTVEEIHAEYARKVRVAEEWRTIQLSMARIDRASATERADHEYMVRRSHAGDDPDLSERIWTGMIDDAERVFREQRERISLRFGNLVADAHNERETALREIGIETE